MLKLTTALVLLPVSRLLLYLFYGVYAPLLGGRQVTSTPDISHFFGIIIRIYWEAGTPHHRPHFHAY